MCTGLHVKYLIFFSGFNESWTFSTDFSKNNQISNFMTIRHCGSRVQTGGRTERYRTRRINIFVCACSFCFVFVWWVLDWIRCRLMRVVRNHSLSRRESVLYCAKCLTVPFWLCHRLLQQWDNMAASKRELLVAELGSPESCREEPLQSVQTADWTAQEPNYPARRYQSRCTFWTSSCLHKVPFLFQTYIFRFQLISSV